MKIRRYLIEVFGFFYSANIYTLFGFNNPKKTKFY